MSDPLPEFDNPPVVEVALGVQFDTLTSLRMPQLSLLWQNLRDRFPKIEEHAPIDSITEQFDTPPAPTPTVQVRMIPQPPVPRCWFLNEDESKLIQVQQDRFVHNWRKKVSGDEYPRYESTLRPGFAAELTGFEEFIASEGVGKLLPNQCEVTYVNHITSDSVWSKHNELDKILSLYSGNHSVSFLPDEERTSVSGAYVIELDKGLPLGRLHFSIEPGFSQPDQQPLFRLNLTARGKPIGDGIEGVMEFLDLGREWVVRGFASLTTREMHRAWGRTR